MRYVTPLKEGGSLPAIVEGDDSGLYVMKFRGAGQGVRALIAELICGTLGRALGLRIPELVTLELDASLGRNEADSEIRELLMASLGLNIGLDYLPGALNFDPVAGAMPDAALASDIVWFDAFITNIDRTVKNPNLLTWHQNLWLIDHGAALYFHHQAEGWLEKAASPFAPVKQHVFLRQASQLEASHQKLKAAITPALIDAALDAVPADWLGEKRADYRAYFLRRLEQADVFFGEAARARANLV